MWRSVTAHIIDAGNANWDIDTSAEPTTTRSRTRDVDDIVWAFAIPQPTVFVTGSHTVNAGDAAWAFTLPEPSITRARARDAGSANWLFAVQQPLSVDHDQEHEISAGTISFAFALPQPTVTYTALMAQDHEVDAGDAEFSFALPQPEVTHRREVDDIAWAFELPELSITRRRFRGAGSVEWSFEVSQLSVDHNQEHEINVDDVNWTFTIPEPTVDMGLVYRRFNLGSQPFGANNDTPWEGAINIDSLLLEGNGPAFLRYFAPELGDFGITIILRLASSPSANPTDSGPEFTDEVELGEFMLSEVGGSSISFRGPDDPDNFFNDASEPYEWRLDLNETNIKTWLQGIGTGDIFLDLGPQGVYVDEVAFTFDVEQPSITHIRANQIDVDEVEFAFVVPQSAITHLQAHVGEAGDVEWAFAVFIPAISHGKEVANAVFDFTLSEPKVTRGKKTDAGNIEWAFDVSVPTISHGKTVSNVNWFFATPAAIIGVVFSYTVDASSTVWTFAVPAVTISGTEAHTVTAGTVSWEFIVPQSSITGNQYAVDAGTALWSVTTLFFAIKTTFPKGFWHVNLPTRAEYYNRSILQDGTRPAQGVQGAWFQTASGEEIQLDTGTLWRVLMAIDVSVGAPSLRTVGTGANQLARGDHTIPSHTH